MTKVTNSKGDVSVKVILEIPEKLYLAAKQASLSAHTSFSAYVRAALAANLQHEHDKYLRQAVDR